MWLYVALYLVGLCAGVAANVLLDVQLRRPALSQFFTLAGFAVLMGVIVNQWTSGIGESLLILLWLATGGMAGLGSRAAGDPIP
jgi:hypothetical protein